MHIHYLCLWHRNENTEYLKGAVFFIIYLSSYEGDSEGTLNTFNSREDGLMCTRAVGNAEFGKDLRMIYRFVPILIYFFVRDLSIFLPAVCTSPAKAPFNLRAIRQIDMITAALEKLCH